MSETRVEDIYGQLKQMAVGFRMRPGERLNEGALARQMGVSRTPLREALNRLVAEKMVMFRPGAGFFCRELDAPTIFDLFELRQVIECAAVRLACERASDDALGELAAQLHATGINVDGLSIAEACARDEEFHMRIARLSGNAEMAGQLQRINERIRYIRWVRMSRGKLRRSKGEHVAIMCALRARDGPLAADLLGGHITKRMDQITDAVRQGISNIYMDPAGELAARILTEEEA